ncbi:hypothetical protein V5799_023970 [Amblyomma americanum]|uniref:Uncharacterized protein n=1 Tax=Amblyomma americanum TaxID=6943 RepID=A0AAQ4EDU8_AMBAM
MEMSLLSNSNVNDSTKKKGHVQSHALSNNARVSTAVPVALRRLRSGALASCQPPLAVNVVTAWQCHYRRVHGPQLPQCRADPFCPSSCRSFALIFFTRHFGVSLCVPL